MVYVASEFGCTGSKSARGRQDKTASSYITNELYPGINTILANLCDLTIHKKRRGCIIQPRRFNTINAKAMLNLLLEEKHRFSNRCFLALDLIEVRTRSQVSSVKLNSVCSSSFLTINKNSNFSSK